MAYKPFQMPEELWAWLNSRAERLTDERGVKVSMNDVLREARDVVESVELAAVSAPDPRGQTRQAVQQ